MSVAEIIDFYKPFENEKNIYICNIPAGNITEADIYKFLYSRFSAFGLIYDVRIFASNFEHAPGQMTFPETDEKELIHENGTATNKHPGTYYAFVNFYSRADAANAMENLCGRLNVSGQALKIKYARAANNSRQPLYYMKCYELANYYLGFNGWTMSVKSLKERISEGSNECSANVVCFECLVQLSIPRSGLSCFGCGSSLQYWDTKDICSRSASTCRAKKQAYQFSVQDAFSKLLLVITGSGKIHVEIDTTINMQMESHELLTINIRDATVEEIDSTDYENAGDESNENDLLSNVDENNRQILAELEAESWD